MNEKTTQESIAWSSYLIPIATFIIGSWLVPKMEWISNIVRIWIFAFGVGLLIFALFITNAAQQWLSNTLSVSHTWIILVIIIISLLVFVIVGWTLTFVDKKHENISLLKTTTVNLIDEITRFVADRSLSHPQATDTWTSSDEWFQKSRDYYNSTNNLFVNRYRQRIVDIGYEMHRLNIITEEELNQLRWFVQPESPSIQWTLDALEKYNVRLK